MGLWRYVVFRLLMIVPVVFGVTAIAFVISYSTRFPAGPYISEEMTPEQIQQVIIAHGFDQPAYIRYLYFLNDLIHGDIGYSQSVGLPVTQAIAQFFPATIELATFAFIIAIVIGFPWGVSAALHRGKFEDHAITLFSLAGLSTPIFIVGFLLQYIFFYQFKLMGLPSLPATGRSGGFVPVLTGFLLIDSLLAGNLAALLDWLSHIILPSICLASMILSPITRMIRGSLLEVLGKEFIVQEKAKGLPERYVTYRHALKNALIPVVTSMGFIFGSLLGGAVITETVFGWPGVGRWVTFAITSGDIAAIMGFTIVMGVFYVVINAVVDVLYVFLDPRIRVGA